MAEGRPLGILHSPELPCGREAGGALGVFLYPLLAINELFAGLPTGGWTRGRYDSKAAVSEMLTQTHKSWDPGAPSFTRKQLPRSKNLLSTAQMAKGLLVR